VDSVAVVTRFGKYVRQADRGFNFKLPSGIEDAQIVPVRRQLKMEFGFGTEGSSNRYQSSVPREQQAEQNMVTGDLNSVLVQWVVQYNIRDAADYLYNVNQPEETLRAAAEAVMRSVIGDRTVDEVITVGKDEIERECLDQLRTISENYDMGLAIDLVQLRYVTPPLEVQPSFNDVNKAQQERQQKINVAEREYEKSVKRMTGTAQKLINEAMGYQSKRVNEAQGDVARFKALLAEYQRSPEITKRRIYLETLGEVIPQIGKKVILDERAAQVLPLLQLGGSNGQTQAPK
jgi:membrane protease subunit HflK